MRFAKTMMMAAACAMVAAPAIASPASKLSLSSAKFSGSRAATTTGKSNKQFGTGGFIIPVVIVVTIGLGLYFVIEEDDDTPTSP